MKNKRTMYGRAVDSQRQKVYDAEKVIHAYCRDYAIPDEAQKYVSKIDSSRWFKGQYPTWHRRTLGGYVVEVWHGSGAHLYNRRWIGLSENCRCTHVILHEMAHGVAENNNYGAHGAEFASNYLKFVKRWMGADAAKFLKASFKEHGVTHIPRKTMKTMSPRQRGEVKTRIAREMIFQIADTPMPGENGTEALTGEDAQRLIGMARYARDKIKGLTK